MGARILNMYVYTDGIKGGCKVELTTDGIKGGCKVELTTDGGSLGAKSNGKR